MGTRPFERCRFAAPTLTLLPVLRVPVARAYTWVVPPQTQAASNGAGCSSLEEVCRWQRRHDEHESLGVGGAPCTSSQGRKGVESERYAEGTIWHYGVKLSIVRALVCALFPPLLPSLSLLANCARRSDYVVYDIGERSFPSWFPLFFFYLTSGRRTPADPPIHLSF